jgi:hypothetical protein
MAPDQRSAPIMVLTAARKSYGFRIVMFPL